ncbi:MAG TPA: RecX family transcriptional regulator [Dehalococcoidia bacterium]|nr:RecX family transcriptional regulator [Dehalococcoidia bacterium]
MPRITAIERRRFKRRADIWLDGERAFSLSLELIAASGLTPGRELSAAEASELREMDERQQAMEGALHLLSRGPRSERELRLRLRRRGLGRPAVDAAVERVRELGYLDDGDFARAYVETRQATAPRSRRHLAFELGRRGISKEVAAGAVEDVSDEDAAYQAAQQRLRALRNLDRRAFERRLGTFLTSRGFSYGVARAVIDRCWQDISAAGAEPEV